MARRMERRMGQWGKPAEKLPDTPEAEDVLLCIVHPPCSFPCLVNFHRFFITQVNMFYFKIGKLRINKMRHVTACG